MIDKGIVGHKAVKVFHDHAEEYDSWFADSLVYEIELAALTLLSADLHYINSLNMLNTKKSPVKPWMNRLVLLLS